MFVLNKLSESESESKHMIKKTIFNGTNLD